MFENIATTIDSDLFKNPNLHIESIESIASILSNFKKYNYEDAISNNYEQIVNDFASNRYTMIFGKSQILKDIKKINPNLNLEIIPLQAPNSTTISVEIACSASILETSTNKESSLAFLNFLSFEPANNFYTKSTNSLSALNNDLLENYNIIIKQNSIENTDILEKLGVSTTKYLSDNDFDGYKQEIITILEEY